MFVYNQGVHMVAHERGDALTNRPAEGGQPAESQPRELDSIDERWISELDNDLDCMSLSAPAEPHTSHPADEMGLMPTDSPTTRHDKFC